MDGERGREAKRTDGTERETEKQGGKREGH